MNDARFTIVRPNYKVGMFSEYVQGERRRSLFHFHLNISLMEKNSYSWFVSNHSHSRRSYPNPSGITRLSFIALLIILFTGISATHLSAQSNPIEFGSEVITTDAYNKEDWKDSAGYASVLAAEKNDNDIRLADPGLSGEQFGLYTGYKKLLDYMQTDLSSKVNLESIASSNYKRIIVESQTDPILLKMRIPEFNTKFNSLVGLLLK